MTHLLDTNVCIACMRGHAKVQQHLRAHSPSDCGISSVSLYELLSGVERCRAPAAERQKVESFIQPMHLLPFDQDAALQSARIRWVLQQQGQIIGPYDLMLVGQAISLGVIFVTRNRGEFQRVPGLVLEDWEG